VPDEKFIGKNVSAGIIDLTVKAGKGKILKKV